MKLNNVYKEILGKYINGRNTLYILQGFPYEVYQSIQELGIKHLLNKNYNSYIDFHDIESEDYCRNLLTSLISLNGEAWIYYEEFIALSNILNDFNIYKGEIIILRNNLFDTYYPIPVVGNKKDIITIYEKDTVDELPIFKYYSDCKLIDGILYFSYVNRHYEIDINITVNEINFYKAIDFSYKVTKEYEEISLRSLDKLKNDMQYGKVVNKKYIIAEYSNKLRSELGVINSLGRYFNVIVTSPLEKRNRKLDANRHVNILKKYWGIESEFRKNKFYDDPSVSTDTVEISQGEIVTDIVCQCTKGLEQKNYSDIIVTAPTGAGKSVLFQVPSIYLYEEYRAITIVICPLVALMVDQVKELNDRGISYATYINSSLTFEERKSRLEGIKNGIYSIVYLSPELLLSTDIYSLIGQRKVGLIVVDEAHLVTSWGRDFRVDYWFLGGYLEKVRHGSYYYKGKRINAPILCLTATAVFGGKDDVIEDLESSLQLTCNTEQKYVGYVRRDNIEFIVRHPQNRNKSNKEEKVLLTLNEIKNSINNKKKTIVYFPFKSSIDDTYNKLRDEDSTYYDQIVKYHSGPDIGSIEKNDAYMDFRDNQSLVMLATKAFGMGVNISDIEEVYHFAPTGTLADYVQEIGRAARKLEKGYAVIDYLKTDMHYARTLWGLSGLRHYQIREITKKLYELYVSKRRRNLLISPDTFNYLFDNKSIEMKVKSGLMLLCSDLLETYHFKVITVRSKSLFSKQYITVPYKIQDKFINRYGKYCTVMDDVKKREEYKYLGKKNSNCIVSKCGNVYEIDLASLWENGFSEMTFPTFKYNFFNGKLFDFEETKIVPNLKMIITFIHGYDDTKDKFRHLAVSIQRTFNEIKRRFGGREFTLKEFSDTFNFVYEEKIRKEYCNMLLDLFCYDHVDIYDIPSENWKFIERRRANEGECNGEIRYCIRTQKSSFIEANLKKYYELIAPNQDNNSYITYIPLIKGGKESGGNYFQLIASILQLFDMASYEVIGGRNPEIFVRLNDPQKLRRIALSNKKYKNKILTDIEERHKRAIEIMDSFMRGNFTNEQRWQIIEEYFLGHDEEVENMLSID